MNTVLTQSVHEHPGVNSPEIDMCQVAQMNAEVQALFWKHRLKREPSADEITQAAADFGFKQIPETGYTPFGGEIPATYFNDGKVTIVIQPQPNFFHEAGDVFCQELKESPPDDEGEAPRRKCGYEIHVQDGIGRFKPWNIVRWHEIPAALSEIRNAQTKDR